MRLVLSWLREFVDVSSSAEEIAEKIGLRGFEVAAIEKLDDGDAVIDFEITANRPDCLSVLGLAREVATAYDLPVRLPSTEPGAKIPLKPVTVGSSDRVMVTIEDADLCPRYAAAVAEVKIATSPAWLSARLHAAGVRPISNLVDITNYVNLEIGQPMHAFDHARLAGPEIRPRRARPGETIRTLDGIDRTLEPDMLVIADRDRAQAIAGVMGGAASEVSWSTKMVVFESAYFKPASVRRTSKRLGLKTEASSRFERGADIGAQVVALQRAVALMEQIGAGTAIGPVIDVYPHPRAAKKLHLRRDRLQLLFGATVPDADVVRILTGLGLEVTPTADGWDALAPTFRVDLLREADLIEEVGRHYGFDRLEATFPPATVAAPPPDPRIARDRLVRRVLTAGGLSEAVTFGFIEAKAAEPFASAATAPIVAVANPLSAKFDTLRPSLIPGLVDAVAHNRRHGRRDVRLFEIGNRFNAGGETRGVAVAWTGDASALHWSGGARDVDFFDVKGIVEQLCHVLRVPVDFTPASEPYLVPGQQAALVIANRVNSVDGVDGVDGRSGDTRAGLIGQLQPAIADARGLPAKDRVYVGELHLDLLARARAAPLSLVEATRPLPRHPSIVRDLSIVVSDSLPAAIIRGTIQAAGRALAAPLVSIAFFDRYQGTGVPAGSVSVSVRLTFQADDRTLTDAEVQHSFDTILAALVREHGAVQR
jgi:phenylalanyl-tRNA synthetase beta chain